MIKNLTKNTTISQKCFFCESAWSKAIGLMFAFRPKTLLFVFKKPTKICLHNIFVFFPIDLIYLNSEMKVVELKHEFLPFSLYRPKKKAVYLIETRKGAIKKSKTHVGDEIQF